MQLAPDIAITATPLSYADGKRGVFQTLDLMRQFVESGKRDPSIIKAARAAVYMTPEKSALHEIDAVFAVVRDGVRYVNDVYNVETLSEARKTLQGRQGDCDDQVILLCSLFEAIGYATRFVVAGYNSPDTFEHVYCQVQTTGGHWIDCDPTEREPLGWCPPDPIIIAIERI
jgi:transglutaminase-like putative cysteine protease